MRGSLNHQLLIGILLLLVIVGSTGVSSLDAKTNTDNLWCGQVRSSDIELDLDNSRLLVSATWNGFSSQQQQQPKNNNNNNNKNKNNNFEYSIAVTSVESALGKQILTANSRCVRSSSSSPDTVHWQPLPTSSSSSSTSSSRVDSHSLHLTSEAKTRFSSSSKSIASDSSFSSSHSEHLLLLQVRDKSSGETIITSHRIGPIIQPPVDLAASFTCPGLISCDELAKGPRHLFAAKFGPPPASWLQYVPGNGEVTPANGHSGQSGYSNITKAGIVIGTVVGSAILFALLILLVCGRGGEAPFGGMTSSGIVATQPQGVRGNLTTADQNTTTQKSFPNTNLDLNAKIEHPVEAAAPTQIGRPNMSNVLDTHTPSDRDYRTLT